MGEGYAAGRPDISFASFNLFSCIDVSKDVFLTGRAPRSEAWSYSFNFVCVLCLREIRKIVGIKKEQFEKLKRKFYDENRLFEDRPGAGGSIPWFGDD